MRIQLNKGDLRLELDPDAGGSVSRFRHGDIEILRRAPDRSGPAFDARHYAAFPMVPFVGRIFNRCFEHDGAQIELHRNLPPEPHAIHGHGWQAPWRLDSHSDTTATMSFHHVSGAWPWDYSATQTFSVSETALMVELSVTNLGETAMPAGLGWHPYFPKSGACMKLPTTGIWITDPETNENFVRPVNEDEDLSDKHALQDLVRDTSYSLETPSIDLAWPTHKVTLSSDPLFSKATVCSSKNEPFFCVEPISHAPNAVNSTLAPALTGYRDLAAGETLSGSIQLRVDV